MLGKRTMPRRIIGVVFGSCLYRFIVAVACLLYTSSAFHRFYGNCRIQGADPAVQQARLALCIGVKNVIFNVLTMFKINVPEKM